MRRYIRVLAVGGLFLALGACRSSSDYASTPPAAVNAALVQTYGDTAINNAIVVQRTLYPYNFVPGAAALNDLGRRDVKVIAAHYRDYPGPLSIRKGDAPDDLYRARVREVGRLLAEAGVDLSRVEVSDTLAAGDGMSSTEVRRVMKSDRRQQPESQAGATFVPIQAGGTSR